MRKALFQSLASPSEPLSRTEQWLGLVTLYLVLSAILMGQFTANSGAADRYPTKVITRFA